MLARAGSPLAGEGATFVSEGAGRRHRPARAGGHRRARDDARDLRPGAGDPQPVRPRPGHGVRPRARCHRARAARTLADRYLPEGRTPSATIGAKWAPLGAANDPAGLNANWTAGVGAYYAALGGDPTRPILAGGPGRRPGLRRRARRRSPPPPGPRGPAGRDRLGRRRAASTGRREGGRSATGARDRGLRVPAGRCRQGAPARLRRLLRGAGAGGLRRTPGSSARSRSRPPPGDARGGRGRRDPAGRDRGRARGGDRVLDRHRAAATGWATGPWPPTRPGWARARRSPRASPWASTRACWGWRGPAAASASTPTPCWRRPARRPEARVARRDRAAPR